MTKPPKKKRVRRKEAEAVETEPDAWGRFQRAMDRTVPPKRRDKAKSEKPKDD